MWISEQGRRRAEPDGTALVGRVTLPGDPAGVYLAGERRELPVFGPGGYVWRPEEGEQVLVLKTGQAGEAPCVAGQACGRDWNLAAGEVLIYSGSASIRIGGGGIRLTGDVLVNGKPVLTGEG
ncbi:hypothetical protein ADH75_18440 [Flavonifractor plautii]|uniref:Baseplate assembly protein n=1 Tax=Flavonifractor plautii TaxID=292800 RepID=A0AAX1KLP8_FLAPL|nr:hypothetical protein [Flavonifractor plautii]ANU40418.1 hypothetical protein A4U99_04765 [Flavonifractor plautii]OXE44113.1 hypothetical protein ADH75_18440 [Flavonifractor plautii]QQR06849.1 hypothetical protein I5Q84_05015 [Flavonifractor plautii]UQA27578.1 hypothetical protein M2853_04805 [Flavonifractor plautii]